MGEVIVGGKIYTIFEMLPVELYGRPDTGVVIREMEKKAKVQREQGWRIKAAKGYRKK